MSTTSEQQAVEFLGTIFAPGDYIAFRPVEVWREGDKQRARVDFEAATYALLGHKNGDGDGWHFSTTGVATTIRRQLARAAAEHTNIFYGVAPRFGARGRFDLAWQVRRLNVLWSDVDDSDNPDELRKRCKSAGLPEPSITIHSGNGLHAYWLLSAPYLIDDAGAPPPVHIEWAEATGGKRKARRYIKGSADEKLYLDIPANRPALSEKAQHVTDVLQGIAKAIGGDHTFDLARLLRIPGTLNRKDERNGREPVPCRIVEMHPDRRYPLDVFEQFAEQAPDRQRREKISRVKLPSPKRLTPKRQDRLAELIAACDAAPIGERSETDFALCCWCIEQGIDSSEVWQQVQHAGKFAECGERYFHTTWAKAAAHTREKIFDRASRPKRSTRAKTSADKQGDKQTATPCTDTGNAERFAEQHRDAVRFCYAWGKWLAWDGRRWKIDDQGAVEQLAKQTIRAIYAEAADIKDDEERDALAGWARASEAATRRAAMLRLAQSEPGIPITPDLLDTDPWLLNVENGTIDLRTGQLRDHRREDLLTKCAPVTYRPDATCPKWSDFLTGIFRGDGELIGFMQRLAGYWLTGVIRDHLLPILYGGGANGKSTFVNALLAVLGRDYGCKAAPDLLLAKKGQHPTELTDLFGRRLVACIETGEGRRLAETLAKELSGGDRIRARRMREDFWEFAPTHKIAVATNHKPVIEGTDHAIWRRLLLLPFTVTIPPEQQDHTLPEKLADEAAGILRWCVEGCLAWQRRGLDPPDLVQTATREYRQDEDLLGSYIEEYCTTGPLLKVRASIIYSNYCDWARASGEGPISQKRFGTAMTERGFERTRSDGVWYAGIDLRSEQRPAVEQDGKSKAGG